MVLGRLGLEVRGSGVVMMTPTPRRTLILHLWLRMAYGVITPRRKAGWLGAEGRFFECAGTTRNGPLGEGDWCLSEVGEWRGGAFDADSTTPLGEERFFRSSLLRMTDFFE